MALSDKDKKDIGQIIDTKVSDIVENKVSEIVETKVTKEIGFLRFEMNQRFDDTNQKIDNVEGNILGKIEEIKKMESEDIQALADDVVKIKKKIAFQQ